MSFEPSEPRRKIPKLLQDSRPASSENFQAQHHYLQSNEAEDIGEVEAHDQSESCTDACFSDLKSLLSDHLLLTTDPEILRGETEMSDREVCLLLTSQGREIFEPVRYLEEGISGRLPPKRFHRTFWRAMAGKLLARAESAAHTAKLSHPSYGF
jgi:hypothetical protein